MFNQRNANKTWALGYTLGIIVIGATLAWIVSTIVIVTINLNRSCSDDSFDHFESVVIEKNQNFPSNRAGSCCVQSDNNALMICFGGIEDTSYLGDLWLVKGIEWTYQIPLSNFNPSPRAYSQCWIDSDYNYYLFGGENGNYLFGDFWMFNPTTQVWINIDEKSNIEDKPFFNGAKRLSSRLTDNQFYFKKLFRSSSSNDPTKILKDRSKAFYWKDMFGNFWMFGGKIDQSNNTNEIWTFDGKSWKNVFSSFTKHCGSYWDIKDDYRLNQPSCRNSVAGWFDKISGIVYIYGGDNSTTGESAVGELWKFEGYWQLIGNLTTKPNFHYIYGKDKSKTTPGARYGSIYWIGKNNEFYLFSGQRGNTFLNDVWSWSNSQWDLVAGSVIGDQEENFHPNRHYLNIPEGRKWGTSWKIDEIVRYFIFGYGKNGYINGNCQFKDY